MTIKIYLHSRKQDMKLSTPLKALPLILLLTLGGCNGMPDFSGMMGPKFKPLDSDVAAMAAPEPVGQGKSLYCVAGRGNALFAKSWLPLADTEFRLTPMSRANVTLQPAKGGPEAQIQAMFDLDGQRIVFCPLKDGPPDARVSCSSIYALEDDLQAGIKRTFDIPEAVSGASISCAYDRAQLQKL